MSEALKRALEGMAGRGRRSMLDDRLPEEKRGGLTIIVMSPKDDESAEGEMPDTLDDEAPIEE